MRDPWQIIVAVATVAILVAGVSSCGESDADRSKRQDGQCVSYGAKRGSDQYIQCRATLAKNREMKDQQDDANGSAIALATMATVQSASVRSSYSSYGGRR